MNDRLAPGRTITLWLLTLSFVLCLAAAGCQPPAAHPPEGGEEEQLAGPAWFEDVTDRVGLDFVHDAGPLGDYPMPQAMGSGVALFDFDGDGRLDVYLLNNGGPDGRPNQLFKQKEDGTFVNVSKGSGLDFSGHCMGVAIGDVNNDGRPDVLVTLVGSVRLFLNNGDGTFTDVTREAGLTNPTWGSSAAFFDYDRDGRLDLVVANYVNHDPTWPCTALNGAREYCPPGKFLGTATRLFHNLGRGPGGKGVRFEDVTLKSGLGKVPGPGLGVICADIDGDGWPDIFIANDEQPNRLWINQKDGTFKEEALARNVAYDGMGQSQAGMGIAYGDVDGDGLSDLFVTHLMVETNTLWKQGPRGLFQDRTGASGLAAPRWRATGFGTVLADFNHDGALDLAIVNGRVSRGTPTPNPALGEHWSQYAERNQLFANDGTGKFHEVSSGSPDLCGTANVARGLACGDVNGDGAVDLLLTTAGGRARLFKNVVPDRGHWLMVRTVDPALGGRDALGAEVTTRAGERRWSRLVSAAGSYLSSGDPVVHFGLGAAAEVEVLEVLWPDGSRETFPGSPVDRLVVLRKGQGKPVHK
jgi:enediyne biosynthesis protein E4